jgi:hypothetical protein
VLNYDEKNNTHQKHVFNGLKDRKVVGKNLNYSFILDEVYQISYEDNVILLNKEGIIKATNV